MNEIKKIAENFFYPGWWRRTAYPYVVETVMKRYFSFFPRKRCEIMEEDWDNLLLLDACRHDMFKQQNILSGDLSYRISKGSSTGEFFEGNFSDSTFHDTVYVTANPVPRIEEWCHVDINSVFYKVIDVWEQHWDKEENTVPPKPVSEAIQEARSQYPHKRIIGHFLQPHQPFIGDAGAEIEEQGLTAHNKMMGEEYDADNKVWKKLERGEISAEQVWRGYRENLDIILPHIQGLCADLGGKTVVTSDHGNLVGEFAWPFPIKKYGHPKGIHSKKLVKVPWLEIESRSRPEIITENPEPSEVEASKEERLERLHALGYY